MPARKKVEVTETALIELGAEKLASNLFEFSERDAAMERRLRLALTAATGSDALAAALSKRIGEIRRGTRFIEWREAAGFAEEIDQVRVSIADDLAPRAPRTAADLLQDFLDLYPRLIERVDDSGGELSWVFSTAVTDWVAAWSRVPDRKPRLFADLVMAAYDGDQYGIMGRLIAQAADALGQEGLLHLKNAYMDRLRTRTPEPNQHGFDYRLVVIVGAVMQVGDALGDVDMIVEAAGFASRPTVYAVDIAERLLRHGRPAEARLWAERGLAARERDEGKLIDLWIAALDALGDREAAQRERWNWFERRLSLAHFTAYVAALPESEREAATARAVDVALADPNTELALAFLADIGCLAEAERLIRGRHDRINGRAYYSLRPVAEKLADERPLGAMLLHRILCCSVLEEGRSKSYHYAAHDLVRAGELASMVRDLAGHDDHDAFVEDLRLRHGRKRGFWQLLL